MNIYIYVYTYMYIYIVSLTFSVVFRQDGPSANVTCDYLVCARFDFEGLASRVEGQGFGIYGVGIPFSFLWNLRELNWILEHSQ